MTIYIYIYIYDIKVDSRRYGSFLPYRLPQGNRPSLIACRKEAKASFPLPA